MTDFHIKERNSEKLPNLAKVLPPVSGKNWDLNLGLSDIKAMHGTTWQHSAVSLFVEMKHSLFLY